MSKETTEAWVLAGQIINAIYEVAEDGKVNLEDLARIFPVILGAPKGVEGFKLIGPEQDTIDHAGKATIRTAVFGALSSVPPADRDDWADVSIGILAGYRLARRAGRKEATEAILKALKEKGASAVISDLDAA